MSDLPPGVTESMIPGCGGHVGYYLEEDFEEVTRDQWESWQVGEGEATCDLCSAVVGFYLGRSDRLPDVEAERWATCWVADDDVACDDCKTMLLEQAERAQAEIDAAMEKYGE